MWNKLMEYDQKNYLVARFGFGGGALDGLPCGYCGFYRVLLWLSGLRHEAFSNFSWQSPAEKSKTLRVENMLNS